jgi:hypothetical protein
MHDSENDRSPVRRGTRLNKAAEKVATATAPFFRFVRLENLALILVVLAASLAMSPNVADPDLWGHVQFGRDVLEESRIPEWTTYSYTAREHPWINHENLSEIIMAIVADSLGPIGLVLGKFLLGLLVIGVVLRANLRNGCGRTVASIMTLLVAANLGYHWSLRPQLASFAGFALLLFLFQGAFQGWRDRWHLPFPRRWFAGDSAAAAIDDLGRADIRGRLGYDSTRIRTLWLLVPLMIVWANSHGGFVAGLAMIVSYLGMRTLEALCRGRAPGQANAGWGIARRMVLMAIVAIAATLINPYGPALHRWLIWSLGSPRPEISDWANSPLWTLVGMKLWILVACTAFALAMSRRRLDATHTVVLVLLLWQSISHFRHVPFFAIAAGLWIGPHLQSAMDRFAQKSPKQEMSPRMVRVATALVVAGILAVSVPLGSRLSDVQVQRDKFPVDAMDFLRSHGLSGRIVVTYDWAQYTIAALCTERWAAGPKSTVAFDGRFRTCYPQTIVDMHFDFLYGNAPQMPRHRSEQSPPIDPARVLHYGQPDLVLLRRFAEQSEKHMRENADEWVILYQDAIAQVWGRRKTFDDPETGQWVAPQQRVIHDRRETGSVSWPAIRPIPAVARMTRSRPSIRLAGHSPSQKPTANPETAASRGGDCRLPRLEQTQASQ